MVSVDKKCFLVASSASWLGGTEEVKKSFGNAVPVPKRSVAGVEPVAPCMVLRQPSKTRGRDCVQEEDMDKHRGEVFRDL